MPKKVYHSKQHYHPMVVAIITGVAWWSATFDTGVFSANITSIAQILHYSQQQISLILSIYILISGMFIILFGRLSDRFGYQKIFKLSAIGFIIFSILLTVFVHIYSLLILLRVGQGFFLAGLMASSTTFTVRFVHPQYHKLAGSWMVGMFGLGMFLGVLTGHFIISVWHMRFFFMIETFFGLFCLWGSYYIRKSTHIPVNTPLKMVTLLGIAGILLFINLALIFIKDTNIFVLFMIMIVLFGTVIILYERRAPNPLMHLSKIKFRQFYACISTALLFGLVFMGMVLLTTFYLKSYDMSKISIGWLLTLMPLSFSITGIFIAPFLFKIPLSDMLYMLITVIVQLITVIVWFVLIMFVHIHDGIILGTLVAINIIVFGFAASLSFALNLRIMFNLNSKENQGLMGGLNRAIQALGLALGSTLFVMLVGERMSTDLSIYKYLNIYVWILIIFSFVTIALILNAFRKT